MRSRSTMGSKGKKPTGPGRPRSTAANQAILRAAFGLFIENGIDGVSIERVAESAGVARTTVYRRWTSKEELIAAAIATERGNPEQAAVAGQIDMIDVRDSLIEALVATVTAPNYRKLAARLVGSVTDYPKLMSVYWRVYLLPRRKVIRGVLERAQADGLINRNHDPEILLDLIGGAIMYQLLVRPGERSTLALRKCLREVVKAFGVEDGHTLRNGPTLPPS